MKNSYIKHKNVYNLKQIEILILNCSVEEFLSFPGRLSQIFVKHEFQIITLVAHKRIISLTILLFKAKLFFKCEN